MTTTQRYPTLNTRLLTRTLQHIQMAPKGWNQKVWRQVLTDPVGIAMLGDTACGTAMCFAGEAAELAGKHEWLVNKSVIAKAHATKDRYLSADAYRYAELVLVDKDFPGAYYHEYLPERLLQARGLVGAQWTVSAQTYAIEVLGLDGEEATVLFNEKNTLEDLESMVQTLLEGNRGGIELENALVRDLDADEED